MLSNAITGAERVCILETYGKSNFTLSKNKDREKELANRIR